MVLEELRKELKSSLQQTGKLGESKDGMDISLFCLNNIQMMARDVITKCS